MSELEKLEQALYKACELIDDWTGSCPLDMFSYRLKRCDNCDDEWLDCWKEYLLSNDGKGDNE